MDRDAPYTDISSPSASRKRLRENESPNERAKREKAAERQRRKRERDRAANTNGIPSLPSAPHMAFPSQHPQDPHFHHLSAPPQVPGQTGPDDNLSPEEMARRERVRASARERQRKHRQLVKQRKMRELGLDMGNEVLPPIDDPSVPPSLIAQGAAVHYRVDAEGNYTPMLMAPPDLQALGVQPGGPEPPFPSGIPHGGQTFATTLLLSFSCAPLLRQHLLRTLNMTNEELVSLEPMLAEAWDRWDQARRGMHYDGPNAGFPPNGSPYPYPPPPGNPTSSDATANGPGRLDAHMDQGPREGVDA